MSFPQPQERPPAPASPARWRLAGAPISWGVCEVPGWGLQLPPDRVLAEMAGLGLSATELGALGYLPLDPTLLRDRLTAAGLRLVGGFVPLVLHEPSAATARADAERIAALLAAAGADTFVLALVADALWSPPPALDASAWRRVADRVDEIDAQVAGHGLRLALHPHAGTLLESAADIERVLGLTRAGLCFDSGHLLIGGWDPADFVRAHGERIVHVHLKDVDAALAARAHDGELSLVHATQAGLFRPLGQGDARIDEVVRLLDERGYERWLVLEQDTAITGQEPPVGRGPVLDVQASIEYLSQLAPQRGEKVHPS